MYQISLCTFNCTKNCARVPTFPSLVKFIWHEWAKKCLLLLATPTTISNEFTSTGYILICTIKIIENICKTFNLCWPRIVFAFNVKILFQTVYFFLFSSYSIFFCFLIRLNCFLRSVKVEIFKVSVNVISVALIRIHTNKKYCEWNYAFRPCLGTGLRKVLIDNFKFQVIVNGFDNKFWHNKLIFYIEKECGKCKILNKYCGSMP